MQLMTTSSSRFIGIALISFGMILPSAASDDWGTVSGRITLSGDVPPMLPLQITRDEEFCGSFKLKDESLKVNPENNGLANAVIWLSSKQPVPVHPSRADISQPVLMDNRNCVFVPRIVPLRTTQVLKVTNSDSVPHNVSIYGRRNLPVNLQVPDDEPLKKSFAKSELLPVRVDCSTHAWMRAYLLITDHGCVAFTDKDGRFEIPNVPHGEWEFRIWHERPGYLNEVTIDGKAQLLKRGTVKVSVSGAENNVGHIEVEAKHFEEE